MQTQTVFDTKPLLRPKQAEEQKNEIDSMQKRLEANNGEDKAVMFRQLQRIKVSYEAQLPRPPASPDEESTMMKRSNELLQIIVPQMCSQEEMRKAPPGAVDKFMAGENSPKTKKMILEWKNLQLRLRPGEQDAANLERHRPVTSTLNMDNAAVVTKSYFMPHPEAGQITTFTEDQLAIIKSIDPDLASKLALLPNAARAEVKDVITKKKPTQAQLDALEAGRNKRKEKLEAKQD